MKKSTTGEFETAVFAARLRELICDTKTTQKDLAKANGAAKNTVSAYAHGLCSPTLPILVRIAKHFDVSMDYLAGLTDKKQTSESKPAPKRGRDPWRKMAVCNSCDWRRRMAAPCGDWDGMYVHPRDRDFSRIAADRRLLRILQKPPTLSGQRRRQR